MAPTRTSRNRARKSDQPPRSRNAFLIFRCHKSEELKEMGLVTGLGARQISGIIGPIWNSMTEDERRPWVQAAQDESDAFVAKYPNYKFQPQPKGQKIARPGTRKAAPLASTSTSVPASPSEYAGPSTSGYATPEITLNFNSFPTDNSDSSAPPTPDSSYSPVPSIGTPVTTPMAGEDLQQWTPYPSPTPILLPETLPMFLEGNEQLDIQWGYGLCAAAAGIPWHQLDAEATAEFIAFCDAKN